MNTGTSSSKIYNNIHGINGGTNFPGQLLFFISMDICIQMLKNEISVDHFMTAEDCIFI